MKFPRTMTVLSLSLAAPAMLLAPQTAAADGSVYAPVAWTEIGIYPRSGPSMDTSHVGAALSDGTTVQLACETLGATVTGPYGPSDVWDQLPNGTWLPNAYLDTGVNGRTPGVPDCAGSDQTTGTDGLGIATSEPSASPMLSGESTGAYNRAAAVDWAHANVNTQERYEGGDCTWFVSNALWAGGLPQQNTGAYQWTDQSHDIGQLAQPSSASDVVFGGPTKTAVAADFLKNYLVDNGLATIQEIDLRQNDVPDAMLGDIIAYDWDPDGVPDGKVDHLTMVTGSSGYYPLVSSHTNPAFDRGWTWDTRNDNWIEFTKPVKPRVYLLHINY